MLKLPRRLAFALIALLIFGGCAKPTSAPAAATTTPTSPAAVASPRKVIGPAVAGMFYPRHEKDLRELVDKLLAEAKSANIKNLRGLVCPHAGYAYSGKTAAAAYKQLLGRNIHTAIILGPSHHALFDGAALPSADAMETPLGLVLLSPKTAALAKKSPFAVDPPARVERPDWWSQSPQACLPPFGEDTPHTWEHSVEVQLPFLQRALAEFRVVPAVLGNVDPQAAADALLPFLDDETILIASSDLTHYLPYDVAAKLDVATVRTICAINPDWFEQAELAAGVPLACGKLPILTLMRVAERKGWKAMRLDYRNSGDVTGDKSRVVGYAAIAFYAPSPAAAGEKPAAVAKRELSAAQRKFLLDLARKSAAAAAAGDRPSEAAGGDATELAESRACFVTLTKKGRLRGCIGSIFPREPLVSAVIHAAHGAAIEDPRFSAVTPAEMKDIEIEVSVLSVPRRLPCKSPEELLAKLRPGVDGVVLRVGGSQATYLPQVWEQLPEKKEFLSRLCEKAGLEANAWKSDQAVFLIYQVEAFKESKPHY